MPPLYPEKPSAPVRAVQEDDISPPMAKFTAGHEDESELVTTLQYAI